MTGRVCPDDFRDRLDRALLWALLTLFMLAVSPGVGASSAPNVPGDGVVARAWLDDPDSSLTARTALESIWTPFEGTLGRGFTAGTTWLRLKIDPAQAGPASLPADNRLVLRIWPGHLDEVAVFRARDSFSLLALVGDTMDVVLKPDRALVHRVVVQDVLTPFEVLLRLRSTSNHSVRVHALRWDDAARLDASDLVKAMLFLMFTGGSTLLALCWWMMRRNRTVLLFVAFQASSALLGAALLGILRVNFGVWVSSEFVDLLTSIMIPGWGGVLILFHAQLLQDFGARKRDLLLLRSLLLLTVLALVLVVFGTAHIGLMIVQVVNPLLMFLLVLIAFRVRGTMVVNDPDGGVTNKATRQRSYLVIAYGTMAVISIPQFLRVLGFYSLGPSSFDGFMLYSAVSTLLLGGLLVYRARESTSELQKTARALDHANMRAALEAERGQEQSEMLAMLTHELKTPLSVLSLTLGEPGQFESSRDRSLRAIDNMKLVIERCAQVAYLHQQGDAVVQELNRERINLHQLLDEAISLQPGRARIDCSVGQEVPACFSDRHFLMLIVANLLDNALKYGPVDGRIQVVLVAAERDGRQGACVIVTNEVGRAGRPDPERMFDKYHRGAMARYRSGSGLGLYLSREFAGRIGARLALVESEKVRVELWIPL